jgi:hypothetical protein
MSRVSASSTFRTEDYPAEYRKELLPRLFQSLNLLVTQVVSAINGSIEFGINIPSLDNTIEFNFDGTLPSYKWTLNRTPKFVILGQAFEDGEPVAIAFTWGYSSSTGLVFNNERNPDHFRRRQPPSERIELPNFIQNPCVIYALYRFSRRPK